MRHRTVMIELSSKQKAELRAVAQRIKPAVHVGKGGVSEGVVRELVLAFKENELIKVAFSAHRDEMATLIEVVEKATESLCVGGVGKKRSFYRPMTEEELAAKKPSRG